MKGKLLKEALQRPRGMRWFWTHAEEGWSDCLGGGMLRVEEWNEEIEK